MTYLGLTHYRKVATNSAMTARKLRTEEEIIALKKILSLIIF
jgi:hypothetical protein